MKLFAIEPTLETPYFDDTADLILNHLWFTGIYFFLYPFLLNVQRETGKLIDPQESTRFEVNDLSILLTHLMNARNVAEKQPSTFDVRIARQMLPEEKEIFDTVSRETLIAEIDLFIDFVRIAREQNKIVCCIGE